MTEKDTNYKNFIISSSHIQTATRLLANQKLQGNLRFFVFGSTPTLSPEVHSEELKMPNKHCFVGKSIGFPFRDGRIFVDENQYAHCPKSLHLLPGQNILAP